MAALPGDDEIFAYFVRVAFEKWIMASPVMRWFFAKSRTSTKFIVKRKETKTRLVPPSIAATDLSFKVNCPQRDAIKISGALASLVEAPDVVDISRLIAEAMLACKGNDVPRSAVLDATLYFTWPKGVEVWTNPIAISTLLEMGTKDTMAYLNDRQVTVVKTQPLGRDPHSEGFSARFRARVSLPSLKDLRGPYEKTYGGSLKKWARESKVRLLRPLLRYTGPEPESLATLRVHRFKKKARERMKALEEDLVFSSSPEEDLVMTSSSSFDFPPSAVDRLTRVSDLDQPPEVHDFTSEEEVDLTPSSSE